MYSNCILHYSWLEGQYPKILWSQEIKKKIIHILLQLKKPFRVAQILCVYFLYMGWIQNETWGVLIRFWGNSMTCRLFIFAAGKLTWPMQFPGKLWASSHQDPYNISKGTLSSATAGLLLIIIATIAIIVIAVERDSANACNIWPLPGGIYSLREMA